MATLLLSAAGAAVGGALLPGGFSVLGATLTGTAIGRAVGTLAGTYIDAALFGSSGQTAVADGPRLSDLQITVSTEGAPIARLYGRMRLGGQIIWGTNFEEEVVKERVEGGKGLGASSTTVKSYRYYANFAVALCEGTITRLGRVWADGDEINITDFTHRVYTGTETQVPDSLIEAKEGAGNAPAYRGVAYVVFERMPLEKFGNRIPQLTFEVFRAVDDFEGQVKAVTLIPAAGEFIYNPTEVRVDGGGGLTYSENRHTTLGASDFTVSLDQLQEVMPNCASVSLFVAWFGGDLRAANCDIRPKVETGDKGEGTTPISWGVAGLTRSTAQAVSTIPGDPDFGHRPAYGGTPSDNTVVAAIKDLKARGFQVVFTPFLLIDVPEDNTLPDPYTGATGQPPYPWRGRITVDPAPGRMGSPDQTATAAAQIAAFHGTVEASDFSVNVGAGTVSYSGPNEWTYSRFILHCAALAAAAGGVDAFVIGSEMRGLTWVRSGAAGPFLFVARLRDLAAQVKALLPGAQAVYAADWSEFTPYQTAQFGGPTAEVFFHLDPLWTDANIDALGIDNYWPLADWRDGTDHLDYQAGFRAIHDTAYLKANIAGGEGYDWFYASDADREAQVRTPITDGLGKPWVFRFKDIASWWASEHFDRPGGTEASAPTAWVPESKPIWFMELGCPAVDKGANQPNVFFDPKSSESALPYFSRGVRDDLIQRRYLKAFLEWYDPAHRDFIEGQNPQSSVYAGRMVDPARLFLYTWDARPYPAFPSAGLGLVELVWSDGPNWTFGHWLTGRVADAPLAETVAQIMEDHGFADYDAGNLAGIMAGYAIDRIMAPRDALQPLEVAFFFDSVESGGRIRFRHRGQQGPVLELTPDELVETTTAAPRYELTRGQESELPVSAKLAYIDSAKDYEQGTAEARRLVTRSGRVAQASLPITLTYGQAQEIADIWLHETWAARERAAFSLPPSKLALEPSDVVTLSAMAREFPLRITGVSLAEALAVEALSIERHIYDRFNTCQRDDHAQLPILYGPAVAVFLDLPLISGSETPHAGRLAAFAAPWPGAVAFHRSPTETGFALNALAFLPASLGETVFDFYAGPTSRWDWGNLVRVKMYNGQLALAERLGVLGGANLAAIENAQGEWEVIQFLNAELVDEGTYDLSGFLRGQYGTEGAMRNPVPAGARFVLLDSAVVEADMTLDDIGLAYTWKVGPAPYDIGHEAYTTVTRAFDGVGLRPFSPVHVRGRRDGDNLGITWVRRTRTGGDSWQLAEVPLGEDTEAYEVDIMDGGAVVRTLISTMPTVTYAEAQQIADWGSVQAGYTVRVYQLGAAYGRGAAREAVIP